MVIISNIILNTLLQHYHSLLKKYSIPRKWCMRIMQRVIICLAVGYCCWRFRQYKSMHMLKLHIDNHSLELWWRHSGRDSVSNHQPHDCLLNRIFRRRSKKTSKLRVTVLCVGSSPGTGEFPHKWPITRKMFPFVDVIMDCFFSWRFRMYPLFRTGRTYLF